MTTVLEDIHLISQEEEPLLWNKLDHLSHRFPALNVTYKANVARKQQCDIPCNKNELGWAQFWWDFTTVGIPRVDDVQSYRVTHSLCGFQRSMQLLHLQLPALLLAEVVGDDIRPQPGHGHGGGVVTRHRRQHTISGWTLWVRQGAENLL